MQQHPLIAIFLTVGLGFWIGRMRYKNFSIGPVAATLVVGVVIGQMKIVIPDMVKTVFFLLFLFSIGYGVGPQFFRSFKGSGTRQALFAVVMALVCAGTVLGAARIMGYNDGVASGLFAGSQTVSACLGLLGDTVREMPLDASRRDYLLLIIPACYAVTYVFGTIGSAWWLSSVAPAMMGGLQKVKDEAAAIEQKMDGDHDRLAPGQIRAGRSVAFRAYRAEGDFFSSPRTVTEVEQHFASKGYRIIVERVRTSTGILIANSKTVISSGDTVVLAGRADVIVEAGSSLGPEVADSELLNFGADKTPVTVSHKGAAGKTLGDLRDQPYMDGIVIASLKRGGMNIPVRRMTVLHPGDVLTLVGFPRDVTVAAHEIGYADAQTDVSDMVFIGLGIAAGCLLGSFALHCNGIPLSLGVTVGTLIAGLVMGWWRNRKPSFGRIPAPAVWLMSNLGLNMFIAVIGITAGASFLHGLREAGWMIFIVGAICTLLTLTIGIFLGRKVFRFSAPETLGCVAGSRCAVAAIGAVLDALHSDVPNLGYTVTYAVANVALVFSSLLVLFLA